MYSNISDRLVLLVVIFTVGLAGCSGPSSTNPAATADAHTAHNHPSHGPHGGHVVELGVDQFHAELVHDSQNVTIYVLNSSASEPVPIEAKEVTINLVHDGQPAQYQLPAAPDANDPSSKTSRFTSSEEPLVNHVNGHGDATLVLTIDGKSYRGKLN